MVRNDIMVETKLPIGGEEEGVIMVRMSMKVGGREVLPLLIIQPLLRRHMKK